MTEHAPQAFCSMGHNVIAPWRHESQGRHDCVYHQVSDLENSHLARFFFLLTAASIQIVKWSHCHLKCQYLLFSKTHNLLCFSVSTSTVETLLLILQRIQPFQFQYSIFLNTDRLIDGYRIFSNLGPKPDRHATPSQLWNGVQLQQEMVCPTFDPTPHHFGLLSHL